MKKKNKIYIIAEAGVNHNGSIIKAKKLIDLAKMSGADAIKFQTFTAKELATHNAPKAKYQKKNSNEDSQYSMLKKLELKKKYHKILIKYCEKKKLDFLSSGFSLEDLSFLKKLNLKKYKIPSGEINNFPYLKKIASFKKNIILSTGMSSIKEISQALKYLLKSGLKREKISLLHCISEYPTKESNLNLNVIKTLSNQFKVKVGLSDHSDSILAPSLAAALGATIIEKHLTISNKLAGPDHSSSLNPINFRKMVKMVRRTEEILGNGIKRISKEEKQNMIIVRKSIVAKKNIFKGEKYTYNNLTLKRPSLGIPPIKIFKYLGKRAKKNYLKDDFIK